MNEKTVPRKKFIIDVLYFALAAALLYVGVKYALGWILPFIIGFIVALLLKPVIRFLYRKIKIPEKVSAIILVLLVYAVVGFLIFLIGAKIVLMIKDGLVTLPDMYSDYISPLIFRLFEQLRELTARLDPQVAQVIENTINSLSDSTGSLISSLSSKVMVSLSSTAMSVPGIILFILLAIISSVYFAIDFRRITGYLTHMLPDKIQSHMTTLKSMSADLGVKYIKSYTLILLITFAELSIGLLILGVNNAFALAALIAFIDLLPVLGTGAVLIPWSLVNLIMGEYGLGIGLLILYIVIIVVRQILEPRIVGRQIGIHPLAMLISLYVGLKVFGFVGIFVLPIVMLVIKGFREKSALEADKPGPEDPGGTGGENAKPDTQPEQLEPSD